MYSDRSYKNISYPDLINVPIDLETITTENERSGKLKANFLIFSHLFLNTKMDTRLDYF